MTTHQVTYEGPSSLAVDVARLVAEADGIELTAAKEPERGAGGVLLALTVDGTPEAVAAAVSSVRRGLPDGATITVDGGRP